MTKSCKKCKSEKTIDKFYNTNQKYSKYNYSCKECIHKINARITQKLREEVNTIKSSRGCCICGEKNPIVLDFHHVDPQIKSDDISELMAGRYRKKLMKEIPKCVVVCANHHRLIEAKQITIPEEILEKYNLDIAQLVELYTL